MTPFAATACRAGVRQSPDLLEEPVQEGGAHRRAVETGGQALCDLDREPARPLGPGLVGRVLLLLDRRLRRRFEGRRLLRGLCQTRGPRLLGGFVGRGQDRVAFLRKAGARPLDLGERGGRLAALRLRLGQQSAAPSRGAARSWPRPGARRTARAARPG